MSYTFDKKINTGEFDICVDTTAQYGYFEHNRLGDECGGGLWFEANALTDYDGVFELPSAVAAALEVMGFVVGDEFKD